MSGGDRRGVSFFIKFLTEPGDVVVDIFSGSNTTGQVAEELGRRWLAVELDRGFAALSATRFMDGWEEGRIQATFQALESGTVLRIDAELRRDSAPPEPDSPPPGDLPSKASQQLLFRD